jgi:hypothetical protein
MHLVLIALGTVALLVFLLLERRRRARAKSTTSNAKKQIVGSANPLLILVAIPMGLLMDLVLGVLIVGLLFGVVWAGTHFFGPIRPIHEWFTLSGRGDR